jgi:F-type H+-transporting ATPase subunit a
MMNFIPIIAFLQEAVAEHSESAAAEAEKVEAPWLVEQCNHLLGGPVLSIERVIMPPIYGLFGAHWTEPAAGALVIPTHVVMAIVCFIIAAGLVLGLRGNLSVDRPSKGQQLLEMVVETIRDLLDQVIGPYGRRYVPMIGAMAVFILIGNLMGLIPGLDAPTKYINVTGALGVTSFLYYMSTGFRQQGVGYLRHFTGGLTGAWLPMGLMIFVIELMSNFVRPVTLSVRLFVNIFADHEIATTFLKLAPWLVPIFTIVLGVFVSLVQTFIFVMLSMVYLSETVPHEEHDVEEHGSGHVAEAA